MQGAVPEAAAAWYVDVWLNVCTDGKRNIADVILQSKYTINTQGYNAIIVVMLVAIVVVVATVMKTNMPPDTIIPLQTSRIKSLRMLLVKYGNYCAPVSEVGADDTFDSGIAFNKVFNSKTGGNTASQTYTCGVATLCLCASTNTQHHCQCKCNA